MMTRSRIHWLAVAVLFTPACGDSDPSDGFLADNPYGGDEGGRGEDAAGDGGGGGAPNGESGDGERAIAEADIVQIVGDRLYALSAYGGLTVIDVSTPDRFPVLGRYRAHATPFEMYVEGDQVFVMYSEFGSYEYDDSLGGYAWRTSSRLQALDASDPSNITVRGDFSLPGTIQDSRRVGEVLYLVTHENGYCWGCANDANTTITSLDISDLSAIEQVDQIAIPIEQDDEWDWSGQRSVSATNERLYVAGLEFGDWDSGHSIIEVVDISDPAGDLVKGTSIEVAGMIQSRWQMDEHDGTLRVISQPGFGNNEAPPVVQTYSVASADDIVALASLEMVLPRPESLQSVRFDGTRGYAITFERTDPLFTLDLSDPATPKQLGELEIPGWVYHMEPRGDRLLGLGFDRDNPQGSINVSLFDVADMNNPQLLSRVHFGGSWANFAEDQNRVHKAFTILDELGLLLVPFSGWDRTDQECHGTYHSGIQLVDWMDDALTLRGVAPAESRARRALLHDERLLALSDQQLESFDIANRDAPERTASLALANNVMMTELGAGIVVRVAQDWWTNQVRLDVVPVAQAESPQPLGSLALDELVGGDHEHACWGRSYYVSDVFVRHGYAYLVRDNYGGYAEVDSEQTTMIDVVDLSDPTSPRFVKSLELPFARARRAWNHVDTGERGVVLAHDKLVVASANIDYAEGDGLPKSSATFEIVDLSEPGNPTHAGTFERPEALLHGTLLAFGDALVSWSMRAVSDDPSKVRYYLERIDFSGAEPVLRTPINVPGAIAAYDPESERAVTIDAEFTSTEESEQSCWSSPSAYRYDYDKDLCIRLERSLSLLAIGADNADLLATHAFEDDGLAVQSLAASENRLFVRLHAGNGYGYVDSVATEGGGGSGDEPPRSELAIFADYSADLSEASRVTLGNVGLWVGSLHADGERALVSEHGGLVVVDTSEASAPALAHHELYGYSCVNPQTDADGVLCAMGPQGLQRIAW